MRRRRIHRVLGLAVWVCGTLVIGSQAAEEQLGKVHFPVSCSPAEQAQFDRALAMLHSFFYPETVKAFTAITQNEPGCAMAYWGLAMSIRQNPLIPVNIATLKQGGEALNEAIELSDKTYARQLKAGALLEQVFAQQPDHPGLAHYIIHSYDYAPLAARALPAP